jgi:hypothetical protein
MVDEFDISEPLFALQPNPQPQYFGSEKTFEYTTSVESLPPAEHTLTSLQPSHSPVYLATWLQDRTLAVTTQISEELGKCIASKSNTRSRSYGNKQYHMLQYCSFWFS